MDIWIDLDKYFEFWYPDPKLLDGIIDNIKKQIEESDEIEKKKFANSIISELEKIIEKFLGSRIELNYVIKLFNFLNRLFELEINLNYDSLMILLNRRFSDVHLTLRRGLLNLYKSTNNEQIYCHIPDLLKQLKKSRDLANAFGELRVSDNPKIFEYSINLLEHVFKIYELDENETMKDQLLAHYEGLLKEMLIKFIENHPKYLDLVMDKFKNQKYTEFFKKILIDFGKKSGTQKSKDLIFKLKEIIPETQPQQKDIIVLIISEILNNQVIYEFVHDVLNNIRKRKYSSEQNSIFIQILKNLAGNQKYSNLLVNESLTFATDSIFLKNCVIGMEKCSQMEKIIQNMDSKNVFIDMLCIEEEKLEKIKELLIFFELTPLFAEELPESKEMMCKICYLIQTSKYAIVEKNSPSNSVIFELGLLKGLGIKCLSIFDGRKTYYIGDETLEEKNGKIKLSDLHPLKFTDLLGIEHQKYNSDIELIRMLGNLIISEIDERNKQQDEKLGDFIQSLVSKNASVFRELRLHELLAAISITHNLIHENNNKTNIDEIYKTYKVVCKEYNEKPKKKVEFLDYINKLYQIGLVYKAESTIMLLDVPAEILEAKCIKLIKEQIN